MIIPVKYNDVVIGYTEDDGKTITFFETETAREVKKKCLSGHPLSISARSVGCIDETGNITHQELKELNIFKSAHQK